MYHSLDASLHHTSLQEFLKYLRAESQDYLEPGRIKDKKLPHIVLFWGHGRRAMEEHVRRKVSRAFSLDDASSSPMASWHLTATSKQSGTT